MRRIGENVRITGRAGAPLSSFFFSPSLRFCFTIPPPPNSGPSARSRKDRCAAMDFCLVDSGAERVASEIPFFPFPFSLFAFLPKLFPLFPLFLEFPELSSRSYVRRKCILKADDSALGLALPLSPTSIFPFFLPLSSVTHSEDEVNDETSIAPSLPFPFSKYFFFLSPFPPIQAIAAASTKM